MKLCSSMKSLNLPEDSCRHISSTANGDHEIRLEAIENLGCRSLTELVHLETISSWGRTRQGRYTGMQMQGMARWGTT